MRKKVFAAVIMSSLVISGLVGCGNSGSSGESAAKETVTEESASEGEAVSSSVDTANAEYNFSIGTNTSEQSNNHELVAKFKELLEEKSGGKVTATLYENGQLGGDAELTQGVIDGSIDFIIGNPATVVDYIPEAAIFDMPSVFTDIDVARKVLDDEQLLGQLKEAYAKAGISLFGYGDSGFRVMSSNKNITSFDDFSGIKIRTMSNTNHVAFWKALGANPTPMDFSDVYTSLEQGQLDAQENPYDLIYSSKFYECQDYIINTNHLVHVLEMIGSKATMDSLPDDIKTIVEEAAVEANEYEREYSDNNIESIKQKITDSGTEITDLSDDIYAQMQTAAEPVYEQIREQVGDSLVDTMLNLTEQYSE